MLSLLVPLALLGPVAVAAGDPAGDVLVILLDDVGKDLLAVYNGPAPAYTPNLDLLAENGRVYDRAYANPLCAPSRACLMTGRYGFRTGFGTNHQALEPYELAASELCLPELFKHDDLSFQVFNKWHLATGDGQPDTDRHVVEACGFEHFFGHVDNFGSEVTLPGADHYRWRSVRAVSDATDVFVFDGYATGDFSDAYWATSVCKDELVASLNALDLSRRAVFFWAPVAPHAPFQAPPTALVTPQTAASLRPPPSVAEPGEERAYALAMLEALDTVIGEALAEISEARRARLTFIVMGDNGTSREVIHPLLNAEHAKGSVYELGIGVPLIVAGAAVAAPGTRDPSLVHIVDVAATIGDLVGDLVGAPAQAWEDSVSFLPTFAQGLPGVRATVFSERFAPNGGPAEASARALVGPRFKLVRTTLDGVATDELYDLAVDPAESIDLLFFPLAGERKEAYAALTLALDELLATRPDTFCDASDGALAACPCANPGAPDTGCDIAPGTGGVGLHVVRQESAPANRATLSGTGFGTNPTPGVVIRAAQLDASSPIVFGDGLRCVGTPLVRSGAALSAGGVSMHTIGHGAAAPRGTSFYQLWFRNGGPLFCDPAASFSTSNGRALVW